MSSCSCHLPPPSLPVSPERRAPQWTGSCPADRLLSCRQALSKSTSGRAQGDGGAVRLQSSHLSAHRPGLSQPRKDRRQAVKPSKHLQDPPGRQPGEARERETRPLANSSSQRQMRSAMEMRQEGGREARQVGWVGGVLMNETQHMTGRLSLLMGK